MEVPYIFTVIAEGDANFYSVKDNKGNWIMRIQMNGEILMELQKKILNWMFSNRHLDDILYRIVTEFINEAWEGEDTHLFIDRDYLERWLKKQKPIIDNILNS